MQHANRQREYGRIEKLAQREILKVEKEYARDRDSLRERDTKVLFNSFLHLYCTRMLMLLDAGHSPRKANTVLNENKRSCYWSWLFARTCWHPLLVYVMF